MSNDEKPPSKQTSWLDRLVNHLSPAPENRDQLADILQKSHESSIIDDDALQIMEGALRISELHAGDIMIPRSQMEIVRLSASPSEILTQVTDSGPPGFLWWISPQIVTTVIWWPEISCPLSKGTP